jgi:hypothetical protein
LPIWALVFALAASVLVAGWFALPSSPLNQSAQAAKSTAAAQPAAAGTQPAPVPPPVQVRVADAQPAELPSIPAPSAAAQPALEAEPAGAPAHTGSNPVSPPVPPAAVVAEVAPPAPPPTAVAPPAPSRTAVAAVPAAPEPAAAGARQAGDLVNLNSASVEELNALRGGGRIGKAIVRGRPYASVEELVTKRVLSRSVYNRVKDQVAAR